MDLWKKMIDQELQGGSGAAQCAKCHNGRTRRVICNVRSALEKYQKNYLEILSWNKGLL